MEHIKPSTMSTLCGIFVFTTKLMSFIGRHILMQTKCGTCVSMRKKISLTATEKPVTETYLTLRKTYHGNKTDIRNE
jgi:hypothetical protein